MAPSSCGLWCARSSALCGAGTGRAAWGGLAGSAGCISGACGRGSKGRGSSGRGAGGAISGRAGIAFIGWRMPSGRGIGSFMRTAGMAAGLGSIRSIRFGGGLWRGAGGTAIVWPASVCGRSKRGWPNVRGGGGVTIAGGIAWIGSRIFGTGTVCAAGGRGASAVAGLMRRGGASNRRGTGCGLPGC